MTSLVLLMANSIHKPKNGDFPLDTYLIETGLQVIDQLVKWPENEALQSFQTILIELHQLMQQRRAKATMMTSNVEGSRVL